MREQQGEGMEMQGMPEKYFTFGRNEKLDQERLHPNFLKYFSRQKGLVPLQNAACANFAKEKSEALVVERSDG